MGFFNRLSGAIREISDDAAGRRLLRDSEKAATRVRELRRTIVVEAAEIIGSILIDELGFEIIATHSPALKTHLERTRRIRGLTKKPPSDLHERLLHGQILQERGNSDQSIGAGEALGFWVTGLYLESCGRISSDAMRAKFAIMAVIGTMLKELAANIQAMPNNSKV